MQQHFLFVLIIGKFSFKNCRLNTSSILF